MEYEHLDLQHPPSFDIDRAKLCPGSLSCVPTVRRRCATWGHHGAWRLWGPGYEMCRVTCPVLAAWLVHSFTSPVTRAIVLIHDVMLTTFVLVWSPRVGVRRGNLPFPHDLIPNAWFPHSTVILGLVFLDTMWSPIDTQGSNKV